MTRRLSKIRLKLSIPPHPRCLGIAARRLATFTLPSFNLPESSTSQGIIPSRDPLTVIWEQKYTDLTDSLLQRSTNPSRTWGYYIDLLSYVESGHLPLEIHQAVLRKCVPPTAEVRIASLRRFEAENLPSSSHMYEDRFKTVMRNIRAAGQRASLEDYHFILEQFAAVGHHSGALHVYKEMIHLGQLRPTSKTFGLCLQAITHRLTLPIYKAQRPSLLQQTTKTCRNLLEDMVKLDIPFSSVNLDLAVRVLKETADERMFSQMMKIGYGIDLDYPDQPPLEVLQGKITVTGTDGIRIPTDTRQPFSTAALNTTIDMLGRFNNVSKLVQTFEVLTQPLPPQASQHFSQSFDDDEDDFGVPNPNPASTQSWNPPHAKPNTTSYNLLLKHVSRAGHATFARHYLQQAYRLDRESDRALRSQLINPPESIIAPHFSINRGTILPVFGEANRNKNMQLMQFTAYIARQSIRRKKNDIVYYSAVRDRMRMPSLPEQNLEAEALQDSAPHSVASSSSSSPLSSKSSDAFPAASGSKDVLPSALDLDLDAPFIPPSPPPKRFDINLHLSILLRDLREITILNTQIEEVIARTTQRVKERLGRRVWAGKNIFLLHDAQRQLVSKDSWTNIVSYRQAVGKMQKGGDEARSSKAKSGKRDVGKGQTPRHGWIAGYRGLATSAIVDRLPS